MIICNTCSVRVQRGAIKSTNRHESLLKKEEAAAASFVTLQKKRLFNRYFKIAESFIKTTQRLKQLQHTFYALDDQSFSTVKDQEFCQLIANFSLQGCCYLADMSLPALNDVVAL